MKKKISVLIIIGLVVFTLSQGAWAGKRAKITGEISDVNPQDNSFGVSGPDRNIPLKVDDQTKYRGIKGLAELKLGDVIIVHYDDDLANSIALKERAATEIRHIPCPKRTK